VHLGSTTPRSLLRQCAWQPPHNPVQRMLAVLACCRLDFDEFHEQLWYTLHEWEHPDAQPESDDHIVSKARFHELDANQCACCSQLSASARWQSALLMQTSSPCCFCCRHSIMVCLLTF
jgi:hypothetical protein